jgi:hypothetical protein
MPQQKESTPTTSYFFVGGSPKIEREVRAAGALAGFTSFFAPFRPHAAGRYKHQTNPALLGLNTISLSMGKQATRGSKVERAEGHTLALSKNNPTPICGGTSGREKAIFISTPQNPPRLSKKLFGRWVYLAHQFHMTGLTGFTSYKPGTAEMVTANIYSEGL